MTLSQRLFLIFLFPFTLFAQSDFSFVPHSEWTNYAALAIGDDAVAAVGFSEQCDRPYISYFDRASGEELWHAFGPVGSEYGSYTGVAFADDGSVWAAGWTFESNDVVGDEKALLTHFSADGELLIHWTASDDGAHQALPGVEILADGRVLWSQSGYLDIRNSTGQIGVSDLNLNITALFTAALTATRYAYTNGNMVQIRDEGSQLPLFEYSSDTQISGLIANEQEVYWTDGLSLYHYDVGSQTLSDYFLGETDPVRLAWQGEEVLLYEATSLEAKTWVYSPSSNAISEELTWQMPAQQLLQLEWREDGYYQLGTDLYEPPGEFVQFPYFHGFVQRTANLSPVPAADIGVIGINAQIDSADIGVYDTYWYRGQVFWSGQIEIQNFSDVPVLDSFLIISPADDGIFCVEGRYFQVVPVAIDAQSSVIVDFEYTSIEFAELNEQGNFVIDKELCFYTAAPDHRIDLNPLNNQYCESFSIVDSEEVLAPMNALKVFPNPTRNQLTIELPGAFLEGLEVYDMLGRRLRTQAIEQTNRYQMNLQALPAGTYWIKLKTDQGLFQQRVVVQ